MKIYEKVLEFLGFTMIALILIAIFEVIHPTKSDKEQHITCLELGIGVEDCNKLFKE